MALRARLAAVERKLKPDNEPRVLFTEVPYFEPGPDAEPGPGFRIGVRDPQGRERIFGSLREYYTATAWTPPEDTQCR
jgi:hypothetical protein